MDLHQSCALGKGHLRDGSNGTSHGEDRHDKSAPLYLNLTDHDSDMQAVIKQLSALRETSRSVRRQCGKENSQDDLIDEHVIPWPLELPDTPRHATYSTKHLGRRRLAGSSETGWARHPTPAGRLAPVNHDQPVPLPRYQTPSLVRFPRYFPDGSSPSANRRRFASESSVPTEDDAELQTKLANIAAVRMLQDCFTIPPELMSVRRMCFSDSIGTDDDEFIPNYLVSCFNLHENH